jgi:hypothetical protein
MRIVFDSKLLAYLRLNIERLSGGIAFEIFGYSKEETCVIVTGWFRDKPLIPPVSDRIVPLGTIVSATSFSKECCASTDENLITSHHMPFKFMSDVSEFETIDTRLLLKDEFVFLFIKALDGCTSASFVCEWNNKQVDFPLESSFESLPEGVNEFYLSQLVNSDDDVSLEAADLEIACVVSRVTDTFSILNKAYESVMKSAVTRIPHRYSYMHIPIMTCDSFPRLFSQDKSSRLIDPHCLVSDWPADSIVAQDGTEYFHYTVDGYNDIGWGCAYRSIQTILSWFINNRNFTSRAPSIIELQTLLKDIDYAHASLVPGSKEWIGCIEGGSILHTLSSGKINYKILNAFSIDELEAFLLTDVTRHFVEFGSPVMVGAGSYAYTIVGVSKEDTSVLVLDPHIPQVGTAFTAMAKGFVGWKPIREFLNFKRLKATFVNICIPSS